MDLRPGLPPGNLALEMHCYDGLRSAWHARLDAHRLAASPPPVPFSAAEGAAALPGGRSGSDPRWPQS
ncbi:Hypothetical protein CAP_6988 [Chondromyces apiculatus DSM 436]|uniref:Uncharacterized protein n=1 Tax=Chondromyces apiculatus DSM 436 TaxID=1192034 RepID=A0A017TH77_9BACT|nr:Hypothetical protein CAP_6988 [Chondromyces apiculatus DSM 436]